MKSTNSAQSLLRFELFSSSEIQKQLIAAYTTRLGGMSQAPFHSRNVGYNTQDERTAVLENIRLTLKELHLDQRQAVLTNQVHGDRIVALKKESGLETHDQLRFADGLAFLEGCDGVVTDRTDVALMTFYADCTAIMIYDPVQQVLGMAHSGWKGTTLRIGQKLVDSLQTTFGSLPKDLLCVIGPTALGCCYEVDEQVKTAIEAAGLPFWPHATVVTEKHERYKLNMETLNQAILIGAGVPKASIELSGQCTICGTDLFYSYRREGAMTGRMSAVMGLKNRELSV